MGGRDLDRFERESAAFFAKVADGFAEMAAAEPDRWIVVDGNRSVNEVAAEVKQLVLPRIPAEESAT